MTNEQAHALTNAIRLLMREMEDLNGHVKSLTSQLECLSLDVQNLQIELRNK